ncbi:MAG TPA: GH1 family beta-glucosidase [Gemmatimonadaceae bacterium]|nr:GH1 family beta-glucosidase [Gemmatimonadaceae bacterium]
MTRFPTDFLWGAATSAYQIEGSPLADGAGPSIWHRFVRTPGNVAHGDTGDVACDHYRRAPEDVALLAALGLRAYRFSVAWARVLPHGTGRPNAAGLAFYDRLVDALLARGIAPNLTLYHWDLPAALDDRGGWLNRDVAEWFGEYADVVGRALGDRVAMWATLNEPWVVMDAGYLHGVHAPGHRSWAEAPRVAQNLLRAHGRGVQALRAAGAREVGLVVNLEPKYAASDAAADVEATARADAYMNRQFLDPVFRGAFPTELRDVWGEQWPEPSAEDLALMRERIDWIGVNYYTRNVVRDAPAAGPVREARVRQPRSAYTEMPWEVWAQGLEDVLRWVHERYGGPPIYVTENGASFYDPPVVEGDVVEDPLRVAYYREHLRAAARAIAAGVKLRGYFAWSLLDNFEWGLGYSRRFGIVHVDFETQRRTLKRSAHFLSEVARTGVVSPEGSQ